VATVANAALQKVTSTLEEDQEAVQEELEDLSEEGEIETLGDIFTEEG